MRRCASAASVILAALALSCSAFIPRDDHAAAREVLRAAEGTEQLLGMRDYLSAFPEGSYAEEFLATLDAEEGAYFRERRGSVAGLSEYEAVYPTGRYASELESRRTALAAVETSRNQEASSRNEAYGEVRETAAEARRLWASRAVAYWTRVLLSVDRWGAPMTEVVSTSPEFDEAFRAEPRPDCTAQSCTKSYAMNYAIPVPGRTQMQGTVSVVLRLHLRDQALVGADLLLPNRGFARWYELENREPVADFDPESRELVVEWSAERIVSTARRVRPNLVPLELDSFELLGTSELDDLDEASEEPAGASEIGTADEDPGATSPPETAHAFATAGANVASAFEDGPIQVVIFWAEDLDEGIAHDGISIRLTDQATAGSISLEDDASESAPAASAPSAGARNQRKVQNQASE